VTSNIYSVSFDGEDIVRGYIEQCSNWGRWGEDDQIGTMNYVGPEQRIAAAKLVRSGKVISMTLPYDDKGPQVGGLRNNPKNVFTATGADHLSGAQDEVLGVPAHGFGYADDLIVLANQSGTQWDALGHIFFEGQMYNGRSAGLVSSFGAAENGIEHYADRMVMRGVLLDVARFRGVEALDPGTAIGVDELEAVAEAAGVEVGTGDALVIRTGFLGARRHDWGDYAGGSAPGLSLHTAPWLHENQIAAIVSDTWGIEVRPNEVGILQPLHVVALVHMGMAFGEIFDLDALADDCSKDGTYEFMFVAPPLPITGAVGSPVGALALK